MYVITLEVYLFCGIMFVEVEKMPKKQTNWTRAYNERAYDRLSITIPKGRKADVEAAAQQRGLSVNGLVNMLLRDAAGLSEQEWNEKTAEPGEDHGDT